MKRKIFPTLLNTSERRALAKLSTKSRCSQSVAIRYLIHDAPLAQMCRDLIAEVVRDRTFPHRAMLLRELRSFVKAHGGVPELQRLLEEHGE